MIGLRIKLHGGIIHDESVRMHLVRIQERPLHIGRYEGLMNDQQISGRGDRVGIDRTDRTNWHRLCGLAIKAMNPNVPSRHVTSVRNKISPCDTSVCMRITFIASFDSITKP